jgi:outer membrane protein OmpA-like peptidoglycan-associated protein
MTGERLSGNWGSVAPYVGLGAGYTAYTPDLDVEGVPADAKIIGSYATPSQDHVFDLGVGFHNQTFSQEAAPDRDIQSPVFEAAYRYQLDNGIQTGLVWNTIFNDGESYGANQADAQFVGLQALKEFPISNDWAMRAGGRYMTDVNVEDTWLNVVMIDLQFGWNPNARTVVRTASSEHRESWERQPAATYNENESEKSGYASSDNNRPMMEEESSSPGVPMTGSVSSSDMQGETMSANDILARKDILLFENNSASLDAQERNRLEKLAAALKDNEDVVREIEVVGYADPSGSASYNKDLSQKRAEVVKKSLEEGGLDGSRIKITARGEEGPAESYDKSRRAEIRFKNVQDEEKLHDIVKSIE